MIRRRVKYRGLPRATRFVLLALAVLAALYFFMQSGFFTVTRVLVEGNRLVSSGELVQLAGLPAEINLWRVDERQVLARLASHPLVESVELRRHPPGTVVLRIQEREALVLLPTEDGFLVLDRHGAVMERVRQISDRNLPLVSGLKLPAGLQPGQSLSQPGLTGALQAVESLPPEMQAWVPEINAADPEAMIAFTREGVQARLGSPERLAEKWKLLAELKAGLVREGKWSEIHYIDLSYRGYPVVK